MLYLYIIINQLKQQIMKIKNYLPRTQEHKAFLSNFLAPLTAFLIAIGAIIYHFN